jgi:hypothetical protein
MLHRKIWVVRCNIARPRNGVKNRTVNFRRCRRLVPVCFDAISGNVPEQRYAVILIALGNTPRTPDPRHPLALLHARRTMKRSYALGIAANASPSIMQERERRPIVV